MSTWVRFTLIKKPAYDGNGNILPSIVGRRNRKGVDEFHSGGSVYPDLTGYHVIDRYKKDTAWLVLIDDDPGALISKADDLTFQATPKLSIGYNFKDFKAKKLDSVEAYVDIVTVFGLPVGTTIDAQGHVVWPK